MKLWEPTKCCCCCDVRTGSLVIATILLVGGSFGLLGGIKNVSLGHRELLKEICQHEDEPAQCEEDFHKFNVWMGASSIVSSCFHILFSSFLLYGILKKKTAFFIPLMTVYTIQICLMILVSAAVVIVLLVYLQVPGVAFIVAGILGLFIFLETYCLLVIRAHYYEIKRDKGQIPTLLRESEDPSLISPTPSSEPPPYPGNDVPLYPDQRFS